MDPDVTITIAAQANKCKSSIARMLAEALQGYNAKVILNDIDAPLPLGFEIPDMGHLTVQIDVVQHVRYIPSHQREPTVVVASSTELEHTWSARVTENQGRYDKFRKVQHQLLMDLGIGEDVSRITEAQDG